MKNRFAFAIVASLLMSSSLVALAATPYGNGYFTIRTVDDVAELEGKLAINPRFMADLINAHRCLTKSEIVEQIDHHFYEDPRKLSQYDYYGVTEKQVVALLNSQSRNQILAAELKALSEMAPHTSFPHYAMWSRNLAKAKAAHDKQMVAELMAQVPMVTYATGLEGALAVPFAAVDGLIDLSEQPNCQPLP